VHTLQLETGEDRATMSGPLDEAIRKLETSLGLLEASVSRRLAAERTRGDLETELQIMQDDRARLAVELDGTSNRLGRLEATAEDVGRRVDRAIGAIQDVIQHAPAARPRDT
jgi:predicted  nucleic acid-binding Zn-ribbon protein